MTWELRRLQADDQTSAGFHIWTPSAPNFGETKPTVLLGQPYDVNSQWAFLETARELTDRGFFVVATEIRGNHGTQDPAARSFTFNQHLEDYRAIAEAVVSFDGVDRSRFVLHGYSYTSVFAALIAPEIRPALVVLQAPALYPDEHMEDTRAFFAGTDPKRMLLMKFLRSEHFDDQWSSTRAPLQAITAYTGLPVSRVAVVTHALDEVMFVGVSGSYVEAAAPGRVAEMTLPRLYHFGPQGHTVTFAKPIAELIERELPLAFPRRRRVDVVQSRYPAGTAVTAARLTVRVGDRVESALIENDYLELVVGDRDSMLQARIEDHPLLVRTSSSSHAPRFSFELLGADGLALASSTQFFEADHHVTKRRVDGVTISGWHLPAYAFGLLATTDEQDHDAAMLGTQVSRLARMTDDGAVEAAPLAEIADIADFGA